MKRITPTMYRILTSLDGAWEPVRVMGGEITAAKALSQAGMVNIRVSMEVQNSYYYGKMKKIYHVTLTNEGSDFIYNGGIDH